MTVAPTMMVTMKTMMVMMMTITRTLFSQPWNFVETVLERRAVLKLTPLVRSVVNKTLDRRFG